MTDLREYEKKLEAEGYKLIGGTDEVGRGPLVGPVVAACCVLGPDFELEGLTDSKKLSERKRELFASYIKEHALAYGIGIVSPEEIDKINILEASRKAMMLAVKEVRKKIPMDYLLTDAMKLDLDIPVLPIIKGDAKSINIAAASVIAKVTRDAMMVELDKKYPEYGFAKHKGYPTKKHLEAIEKYGIFDGYRVTYEPVRKILERN